MALNPSGQISIGGPTVGQSINLELGLSATANSSLNQANFRSLAGIPSGAIALSNFYGKSSGLQRVIIAFGFLSAPASGITNNINLVSNTGVVAANSTGAGTARGNLAAARYGGDKAIFGFGSIPSLPPAARAQGMTNLVSNTGVLASDTPQVPGSTARYTLGGAGYGGDKGIFGFGDIPSDEQFVTNLVSNTGVVAANVPNTAQKRAQVGACSYGGDKAIFGFGSISAPTRTNITNLVSNTGVVAANTTNTNSIRTGVSAVGYGGDKGIFAFGFNIPTNPTLNVTALVSNTGVLAADIPAVGPQRSVAPGGVYGGDKAIMAFGASAPLQASVTLVSNTGVLAALTPSAGTGRTGAAGASYSL